MDKINLKVKIYLENEQDKFMGIGVLWLLQGISECNSLRGAAAKLGISYSKAYRMVQNLEKSLGVNILQRRRGGMQRSGASLTDFGKAFIDLYDQFQQNCKSLLQPPFQDFQSKLEQMVVAHTNSVSSQS